MTLYVNVDGATAADTLANGTTSANGFLTIQYAIDVIPGLVGGDVVINIDDGEAAANTYAEEVTIQGKAFTGNYTITVNGNLLTSISGTQSANGLQGAGANMGYFTDTVGGIAGQDNLLAYLDADGDYRIVDSDAANVAYVTGYFTSQPLNGENYIIYDWGTSIQNIIMSAAQTGVVFNDIKVTGTASTYSVACYAHSESTWNRCNISTAVYRCLYTNGCAININYCLFYVSGTGTIGIYAADLACIFVIGTMFEVTVGSPYGYAIALFTGAVVKFLDTTSYVQPNIFDGNSAGNRGIWCVDGMVNIPSSSYSFVRNWTIGAGTAVGLLADNGGMVVSTVNIQYNNNDTDELDDAVVFSYVGS